MKRFNTTAVCIPSKHYMVDLSERVSEIEKLVVEGKYLTINCARQYGKTTTLRALQETLQSKYTVLSLSFEGVTKAGSQTEGEFVQTFSRLILDQNEFFGIDIPSKTLETLEGYSEQEPEKLKMDTLFRTFRRWIARSKNPVVLIIDEVDSATDNQVFLDFLGLLRDGYIARESNNVPAFQSVILAGVTDVRHLQSKIRNDDQHKLNSPWNIAADFDIDMSLSKAGIKGMLDEYEADHHTGMDTGAIAAQIRDYTNGYPFLVSRICELIDTRLAASRPSDAARTSKQSPVLFNSLSEAWTSYGIDEAVRWILSEENTLFESLMGKLENAPHLKSQLRKILLRGETIAHMPDDEEQKQLRMYGFIVNNHNTVAVANRIFEMRLYQYFIGESSSNDELRQAAAASRSIFLSEDGWLDIPKIMAHFITEHNRIHKDQTRRFLEEEGRERFLTYLAPIINGTGTYSIEEQTRDHRRMDLVIHYLGRRYIIEMKIWRGERYKTEGEKQISDYLNYWGLDTGYLLSFSFNRNKKPGVERIRVGSKVLFEGIV